MSEHSKPATGGVSNTNKTPPTEARSRNWCITINNCTDAHQNLIKNLECEFVFQKEKGEQGTEHIQGLLCFKDAKSFNFIKKKLPTAHIEKCKNLVASKLYCSKAETRIEGPWMSENIKMPNPVEPKPVKKRLDPAVLCQNAISSIMNELIEEQTKDISRFKYMEKVCAFMDVAAFMGKNPHE